MLHCIAPTDSFQIHFYTIAQAHDFIRTLIRFAQEMSKQSLKKKKNSFLERKYFYAETKQFLGKKS